MKFKILIPIFLITFLSTQNIFAGTKKAVINSSKIIENVQNEKEQREVLTVDEAVSKAIEFSKNLKDNEDNIGLSEESLDNAMRDIKAVSEGYEVMNFNIKIKELNKQIKNYKVNSEIEKQSITLSVVEYFADILKAEKQLALYDENIKLTEKELEIEKAKLEMGRISLTEYNSTKTEYENLSIDRNAKETEINSAYSALNQLIGCRDLDKKYTVSLDDIEYEPLGEVDFESDKTRVAESSQKIVEAKEKVEIEKYKVDAYTDLVTSSASSKESQKISYANSMRDLEDTKIQQKNSFTELYNSIITSENDYNKNIKQLETLKKQLELLKVKVTMGKATQLEVDKAEYEINSLKADVENSVYSHYVLVEKYKNPDLL